MPEQLCELKGISHDNLEVIITRIEDSAKDLANLAKVELKITSNRNSEISQKISG